MVNNVNNVNGQHSNAECSRMPYTMLTLCFSFYLKAANKSPRVLRNFNIILILEMQRKCKQTF